MVFFTSRGLPVVSGTPLSDFEEGSLIKLNEGGNPVEFYAAKHDYESGLNGAGRTLLVRKDCYDKRVWDAGGINDYPRSDINIWQNSDYKALLDPRVQELMGSTRFYYTPGNGDTTLKTMTRSVFILSLSEFGYIDVSATNNEGTPLPVFDILRVAYLDNTPVYQYTRTPYKFANDAVYSLSPTGKEESNGVELTISAVRPCFTLPSNTRVNADGLIA